jgi:hypothetical protein
MASPSYSESVDTRASRIGLPYQQLRSRRAVHVDRTSLEAKMTEIDGPAGRFDVATIRIDKEGVRCIHYQDAHANFYFYVELCTKPRQEWIVTGASNEARSGPLITTPESAAVFRVNIEHFLKTRWDSNPARHGDESMGLVPVRFSWKIVR